MWKFLVNENENPNSSEKKENNTSEHSLTESGQLNHKISFNSIDDDDLNKEKKEEKNKIKKKNNNKTKNVKEKEDKKGANKKTDILNNEDNAQKIIENNEYKNENKNITKNTNLEKKEIKKEEDKYKYHKEEKSPIIEADKNNELKYEKENEEGKNKLVNSEEEKKKNDDKIKPDDNKLSKINSKVQFSNEVSNKQADIDFYHNRGKDSRLDLRSVELLDKIEISSESEEEIQKTKKKKKKSKKKKKKRDNKENEKEEESTKKSTTSKEDINPDVANIEITQNDESDGEKKSKKKRKKKDKSKKDNENEEKENEEKEEREFTEEEKELIKKYKKAFHILRKVIRKYKKREQKEENYELTEMKNRFNKWKDINIDDKNKELISKADNGAARVRKRFGESDSRPGIVGQGSSDGQRAAHRGEVSLALPVDDCRACRAARARDIDAYLRAPALARRVQESASQRCEAVAATPTEQTHLLGGEQRSCGCIRTETYSSAGSFGAQGHGERELFRSVDSSDLGARSGEVDPACIRQRADGDRVSLLNHLEILPEPIDEVDGVEPGNVVDVVANRDVDRARATQFLGQRCGDDIGDSAHPSGRQVHRCARRLRTRQSGGASDAGCPAGDVHVRNAGLDGGGQDTIVGIVDRRNDRAYGRVEGCRVEEVPAADGSAVTAGQFVASLGGASGEEQWEVGGEQRCQGAAHGSVSAGHEDRAVG